MFQRLCLMRGPEEQNDHNLRRLNAFMSEIICPDCGGLRLNKAARLQKYWDTTFSKCAIWSLRNSATFFAELLTHVVKALSRPFVSP